MLQEHMLKNSRYHGKPVWENKINGLNKIKWNYLRRGFGNSTLKDTQRKRKFSTSISVRNVDSQEGLQGQIKISTKILHKIVPTSRMMPLSNAVKYEATGTSQDCA